MLGTLACATIGAASVGALACVTIGAASVGALPVHFYTVYPICLERPSNQQL
jgi:hypothetical protein